MRDPSNTSARIYITGLPEGTTEDELAEHFGMLGKVARKKQKRGYPDQWPWKISLYIDESGKWKGDGTLTFEDPNAPQSAPQFFHNSDFKGSKITVEMASEKSAPTNSGGGGGGQGRDYQRNDSRRRDRWQR